MDFDLHIVKNLIYNMTLGNEINIIQGLEHPGVIVRINAIIQATKHKCFKNEIVEKIKGLKSDKNICDGYTVSNFAVAALDILEIEKYVGDDMLVVGLIDSKFEF